jgi:hypothetical protein
MLACIRYVTFSAPTIDDLMILCNAVVRSKLNSVISTDSYKLKRIQRQFAALCCDGFHSR